MRLPIGAEALNVLPEAGDLQNAGGTGRPLLLENRFDLRAGQFIFTSVCRTAES